MEVIIDTLQLKSNNTSQVALPTHLVMEATDESMCELEQCL